MTKILSKEVAFNGRLRTAIDGASIGANDFQTLKNLRPTETNVRPVAGMTKVNTSALASTGIRNGFHFRKSLPVEYHVLAWTSDGKVWVNNTAAPAQGAFEASALFTDTAGGSTGRFSNAPGGALSYANGKEACLWGGTEHRCAGLIDYPTTEQVYDYSDLVTNTKTDDNNVATIHTSTASTDANTMLLLHCDGTHTGTIFTDSATAPKTVTAYTGAVTSSTQTKFGATSGYFPATGYLSTPDHADFDFSGGTWTVDLWVYPNDLSAQRSIYYQQTDANNYMDIKLASLAGGSVSANYSGVALSIYAASSQVVSLYTHNYAIQVNTWNHVAVVESGDNYYIFINGSLIATTTDANRPANYTGSVQIGYNNANYFAGYMDELRVSNTGRWIAAFAPPAAAYGASYVSTTYIGSIMPLDGVKLYVQTANDQAATMTMQEWDGASWPNLTITDNTSSGGRTLAQTGTVTWASTASTSKPTAVQKLYIFWYKMTITGDTDFGGVTLSQVTVSIPCQAIKDVWDGESRPMNSVVGQKSSVYYDFTSNVLEDGYTSTGTTADASTYAAVGGYTSSDYIFPGCNERLAGLIINIIDENVNTNDSVMSVDYWNGSAWLPLTIKDGTASGTKTLGRSGWVTWQPPERASEFMRTDLGPGKLTQNAAAAAIAGMFNATVPSTPTVNKTVNTMYYYRIRFSATLSTTVNIYHISGISTPKDIRGYAFPMLHQNRTVLVSNTDGKKNTILMSASDTSNVFNGLDSYEYAFGQEDEINAGASLFLRFGSSVQDMMMLTKPGEIHILEGNGSDSDPYRTRLLSAAIGCRAPLTMTTIPVGDLGGGVRRQIAVFESQRGIEVFDGAALMDPLLSQDISDKFDPNHANYAGSSSNYGFYDSVEDEYHWCPVGASEWVYSFKFKKWYEIVRGTAKYLYGGFPVMDTSGNSYAYGFDNAGYVYRLENGTTFDGNAIVTTMRIGDMAWPEGSIMEKSRINWYRLVAKVGAGNITGRYYVDSASAPTHSRTISSVNAGKRLMNQVVYETDEQAMLHGIEFIGGYDFEPLYLGIRYTIYPDQLS